MENFKVKVTTEQESKDVQELFFELGFTWAGNSKDIFDFDTPEYIVNWNNGYITVGDHSDGNRKEITLADLRDMVILKRNDVNDANVLDSGIDDFYLYLTVDNVLYYFNDIDSKWELSLVSGDFEYYKRLKPIKNNDLPFIDGEESLNDKVASAEEARQKHSHYKKDVSHLEFIDVYRVLNLFEVESHAVGHAIKKLLCSGQRGAKDKAQDIQEAIDSLNRELEMMRENGNS